MQCCEIWLLTIQRGIQFFIVNSDLEIDSNTTIFSIKEMAPKVTLIEKIPSTSVSPIVIFFSFSLCDYVLSLSLFNLVFNNTSEL